MGGGSPDLGQSGKTPISISRMKFCHDNSWRPVADACDLRQINPSGVRISVFFKFVANLKKYRKCFNFLLRLQESYRIIDQANLADLKVSKTNVVLNLVDKVRCCLASHELSMLLK